MYYQNKGTHLFITWIKTHRHESISLSVYFLVKTPLIETSTVIYYAPDGDTVRDNSPRAT